MEFNILYFFIMIISYFIGNISPAIILSKILIKKDIREIGSGNAGTTNVLRTLGTKAAVATLVFDIAKGVVAVLIGRYIGGSEQLALICGVLAFSGHIWPVVFKFKGGKGVATAAGVIMTFNYQSGIIVVIIALTIIFLTKRVSAGAVIGAISYPIVTYFILVGNDLGGVSPQNSVVPQMTQIVLHFGDLQGGQATFMFFTIALALIVIYKHKENIKRLLKGTEPTINFKK